MPKKDEAEPVVDLETAGCCWNCDFGVAGGMDNVRQAEVPKEQYRGTCHAGPKTGFQYNRDGAVQFVFPDVKGDEWCGRHPLRRAAYLLDVDEIMDLMAPEEEEEKDDEDER